MSYIINNQTNEFITEIDETLKSGEIVRYGYDTCDNGQTLVNACTGKISNARKYESIAQQESLHVWATLISDNDGVFYHYHMKTFDDDSSPTFDSFYDADADCQG